MARWIQIYQERDAELFPFYLWATSWGRRARAIVGGNLLPIAQVFSTRGVRYYVDARVYKQFGARVLRAFRNPRAYRSIVRETKTHIARVFRSAGALERLDVRKRSVSELTALVISITEQIDALNGWGQLVSALELGPNALLTQGTLEAVAAAARGARVKEPVGEITGVLLSPVTTTYFRDAHVALLRAALRVKRYGRDDVDKRLKQHVKRFGWVNYGYKGPVLSVAHGKKELNDLLGRHTTATLNAELKKKSAELDALRQRHQRLQRQLHLPKLWRQRFALIREQSALKVLRKEVIFRALAAVERVHRELGRRLDLSLAELRQLLPGDYGLLERDLKTVRLLAAQRARGSVYLLSARGAEILSGRDAARFIRGLDASSRRTDMKEIIGMCAQPGQARGIVKIIMGESHCEKMRQGNILVSFSTNPQMMAAMKKAAAIVTDVGGVTSHAAIVSRELQIPCVVGARIATEVFRDGDLVDVDATKGVVRRI